MPPCKNNDQDCENKSTITGCHLLPPQKLLTFTYYDPRHSCVMSTHFFITLPIQLEQHPVQNPVPHACYSIWIRSKERSFWLQTEARQYEADQAPTKAMLKNVALKQPAQRAELFPPIAISRSGENEIISVPSASVVRTQKSIAKSSFLLYPSSGENVELLVPLPLNLIGAE